MNLHSDLQKIIERKKREVDELYSTGKAMKYQSAEPRDEKRISFSEAITEENPIPNLIAEFKITSPSNIANGNPDYREGIFPEGIARTYERHGACAMSILTDEGFKGGIDYLERIRKVIDLPLLRKDFIIDPAQIHEARYYGADAILLIAAILEPKIMRYFREIAAGLGMDCLVESHNEEELEKARESGALIYGINNRNLNDFSVDINTTLRLLPLVPEGRPIVTESGILTFEDVQYLSHPRINAMLVGTTLMKADDIGDKVDELLGHQS